MNDLRRTTDLLTKVALQWLTTCEPESPCSSWRPATTPVIDYQTMDEFIGYERLFRASDGAFLLHMSSEGKLEAEERILWLSAREALSWLNEAPEQFGSFWEFALVAPVGQQQLQHLSSSERA